MDVVRKDLAQLVKHSEIRHGRSDKCDNYLMHQGPSMIVVASKHVVSR